MDQQSQELFDRLVKLDEDSLTPAEEEFLFARRGYLSKSQRQEFANLIKRGDERVKAQANVQQVQE